MICRYCGKEIDDNSEKCLYCGKEQDEQLSNREQNVNSVGKHVLYKAAQAAPQRPTVLTPEKSPEKTDNSRKKRIIAGIIVWLLVLGIVVGGGYAIGSIFKNPSSSNDDTVLREGTIDPDDIPDVPQIIDEDEANKAQTDGNAVSGEDIPTVVNYPVIGAWQWSSDNKGYMDTIWVFDDSGNVKVYYIGSSQYDYTNWPGTYEYDENTGILNIKSGAFHLVWDNENQFAIGVNIAIKIDSAVIPNNAVLVNGKTEPVSGGDTQQSAEPDGDDAPVAEPEYIFAESNSRYLTEEDCKDLTADQIRIGRNEIFARHGWLFEDETLKEYFEGKDWYNGYITSKNFSNSVLNKYERANITFLKNMENRLG